MLHAATIAYILLLLIPLLCRSYFSSITTPHLKTGKCGTIAGAVQLYDDDNVSDDHSITYWHVHTDSKGMSTQKKQRIKMMELPFLDSLPTMLVSDSIVLQSSKVKFLKLLPGALSMNCLLFQGYTIPFDASIAQWIICRYRYRLAREPGEAVDRAAVRQVVR